MTTTRQQLLAEGILATKPLVLRFLPGFDDTNHTRQAPGLPNHFAWNLGHLAYTMQRFAEKLDARPLPESDFSSSPASGGAPTRFELESVVPGSTPTADSKRYPSLARCVSIFEAAADRLAAALRASSDSTLDAMTKWGDKEFPNWTLAQRMAFHNGMHAGQVTDLRRALGLGSVIVLPKR